MRAAAKKYLSRYLDIAPIAVSLWRAVEAKHLSTVTLKSPMIDIGCGFGEFGQVFFEKPVDVGIDISPLNLFACAKTNKYKNLVLGDAKDMPFSDNTFATVFSISTFEHISEPKKLLKEAFRVLKPGGILLTTIETTKVDEVSMYGSLFRKLHIPFMNKIYSKKYNDVFKRVTLLPKENWEKLLSDAGFKILKSEDIISPRITSLFEIFLVTSWPSQLFYPFLGRRISWRPKFISKILTDVFLPVVAAKDKNGTNLFVVAQKPRLI